MPMSLRSTGKARPAADGDLAQDEVMCAGNGGVGISTDKGDKEVYNVDLSEPILSQVPHLGASYEEWVHKPSSRPHFRMFESDFFEWFATMSWFMVPVVWLPISAACAWAALNVGGSETASSNVGGVNGTDPLSRALERDLTPASFAAWWVVGLLFWTLSEYGLHRFIFHGPILSTSGAFLKFHFLMHGQHHKFPLDKGRLVFPLVPAFITGAVLYGTMWSLLPYAASLAAMSGLVIGYIAYDLTHYYVHHGKPEIGYFRRLRDHHMQHHFRSQDSGFGITSQVWDSVFSSGHPVSSSPSERRAA